MSFQAKQKTHKTQSFDDVFIDQDDGHEGRHAEEQILHEDGCVPVDDEKSDHNNNALVQDIEWQHSFTGVLKKTIPKGKIPASNSQQGKDPDPGIEGSESGYPQITETAEGGINPGSHEIKSDESR